MSDPLPASSQGAGLARDTVSALRTTPLLLVLVTLNIIFIAAAVWYLHTQQSNATKVITQMLDRCLPSAK